MLATYGWEKLLKDTEAAALDGDDGDVDDDDHDGSGSNDDDDDDDDDVALGGKLDPLDAIDRLIAHFKVSLEQSNDILEEFMIS